MDADEVVAVPLFGSSVTVDELIVVTVSLPLVVDVTNSVPVAPVDVEPVPVIVSVDMVFVSAPVIVVVADVMVELVVRVVTEP